MAGRSSPGVTGSMGLILHGLGANGLVAAMVKPVSKNDAWKKWSSDFMVQRLPFLKESSLDYIAVLST